MDNKELDKLLRQVHDEIHNTQSVDEKESELLLDLEGDIRTLLNRPGNQPIQMQASMVQRLEKAINRFEVTYPELTTLISNLLDSFSSAGL